MALAICSSILLPTAEAATTYNATETAIFGSGNPDNNWVETTSGGITVDLRFKERFTTNMPNDGAGTYSFNLGTSVNVEWSGSSGTAPLGQYIWMLSFDTDPSAASLWSSFPVSLALDNSYGNSSTGNGLGVEGTYASLAGSNTLFQNSFRTGLFPFNLDSNINSSYDFAFTAYSVNDPNLTTPIARAEATLEFGNGASSVPDAGSTLGLLGLALGGMRLAKMKRGTVAA